jgi:hypothetical protein
MQITQIATLMNSVTSEILGTTDVVKEDLSNIVEVGKQIFDATSTDHYVKSLLNHIGKVVFVNRIYNGVAPSVMMDAWEYGSVLEKITCELPEAEDNETWGLENGQTYNQDKFYKPTVSAKFFNKKVTFEVAMSFTELQVKESFSSAEQLNGFLSMLYNSVEKSITVKNDSLIMRTINNMIAATVVADTAGTVKNVKAVNLAKLYADENGLTSIEGNIMRDPQFIKFAAYTMANYKDRLGRLSTLFNIEGKDRFTPTDKLHTILLAEFVNSANFYLQADTFHDIYTKLPNAETVPFWQGSGQDYDFAHTSYINVKATHNSSGDTSEVAVKGILGVMFDRDALGVTNMNKRITTHYNAKAEFYNNFYKVDAGYFNDFSENFVVFYADTDAIGA